MTKPVLVGTAPVPLSAIDISDRLRPVSDAHVTALMASIEEIGLQAEIHVREIAKSAKTGARRYQLLAGGHRVEAFLRQGHDEIPAKIWKCNADQAKLIEIDDNLAHAELEPLDMAVFLAARKRAYERLHPESKRGTAGATARWNATDIVSVASFVTATASKLGASERNIFRLVAAGEALQADMVSMLRRAPRKVTLKDLQLIARLPQSYERADVCRALAEGEVKTAKQAIDRAAKRPVNSPEDAHFLRLVECFNRASKRVKRHFIEEFETELRELLATKPDADGETVVPFIRGGQS